MTTEITQIFFLSDYTNSPFSQRECALAEWEVERAKRKDKLEVLQTQISLSRRNSDISQRSALKNLGEADSNQGYRNRYNLIDRPNDRCDFCEIGIKGSDYGPSERFCINSINISTNLNSSLVQHNGSCCYFQNI